MLRRGLSADASADQPQTRLLQSATRRTIPGAHNGVGEGPSPFERTAEIQCPLIGLFGEADSDPSPADMRTLDAELTKHGKVHEFHAYPGANHAFMNARRERHHAEAAQDSWPKTLAFFEKYLGKVSAASS